VPALLDDGNAENTLFGPLLDVDEQGQAIRRNAIAVHQTCEQGAPFLSARRHVASSYVRDEVQDRSSQRLGI
jgi:hypothetical protein